jgi:hypothetical protein
MSKTVKRAMRVMMIGLVALLGANAEAHYVYAFGKYKYCSLHCVVDLRKVPDPLSEPAKVKCEATASQGDTLSAEVSCPDGTLVQSNVPGPIAMVGQGSIDQSNWNQGKAHVEIDLPMPDFLLKQLSGLCINDPEWILTPGKVKILTIPEAKICVGPVPALGDVLDGPQDPLALDLCSTAASTDTFYNCTIPSGSPRGTLYECDTQTIDHIK